MSDKCYFDLGGRVCTALRRKDCYYCKFRKTADEYAEGQRKAHEILAKKHLVAYQVGDRMTTRPMRGYEIEREGAEE